MKDKVPATLAIRFLTDRHIEYTPFFYNYVEKGGTEISSRELGVDEHKVIKTLIMVDDKGNPLVVLMHGDMSVSAKELARVIGVKSIIMCSPATADKYSGYTVGGTSPFGTKRQMVTYIEKSILDLDNIYINGGRRGFLVSIKPKVLTEVLNHKIVEVGIR